MLLVMSTQPKPSTYSCCLPFSVRISPSFGVELPELEPPEGFSVVEPPVLGVVGFVVVPVEGFFSVSVLGLEVESPVEGFVVVVPELPVDGVVVAACSP